MYSFPPRSALHVEGPSICTGSKACLGPHGAGYRIHQALHPGTNPQKDCLKWNWQNAMLYSSTNTRTSSKLCSYVVRNPSLSEQLLEIPPFL